MPKKYTKQFHNNFLSPLKKPFHIKKCVRLNYRESELHLNVWGHSSIYIILEFQFAEVEKKNILQLDRNGI